MATREPLTTFPCTYGHKHRTATAYLLCMEREALLQPPPRGPQRYVVKSTMHKGAIVHQVWDLDSLTIVGRSKHLRVATDQARARNAWAKAADR